MLEILVALKLPLVILQVILAPILILMVLLQSGKGDDLGSAFSGAGGGSSSILGAGGASKFLVRGTVIFVILFMLNSIALAKIFKATSESSVGISAPQPMVPAPETAAPAEPAVPEAAPGGEAKPEPAEPKKGAKPTPAPKTAPAPAPAPVQKKP